ncbi:MAG: cation:proton antiporter [Phycisphaeraceae bacterium]|nr:cation:proton antiporter [Phycisphaeraceae bacterium]
MHDLGLLTTIAAGFTAAWIFGVITQRLGLSPIVGYLIAGVLIGPSTPGLVGDSAIAQQLAEIGVILLMFAVGLHFRPRDLLAVRNIAVPGAIVQSASATVVTAIVFAWFGWSWIGGGVLGMAMAVASTVVLMRVLMDRGMVTSVHGRVAIGWLIVEDIFTVVLLVMLPVLGRALGTSTLPTVAALGADEGGTLSTVATLGWAMVKLAALVAIMFLAGSRVVPWILLQVARLRSRELFTLTVLVLSIGIAVGSAAFFGASLALGAFLAGMVVGASPTSHQAGADALPMRDAFAVLFFVSVGMLFDPRFLWQEPWLVAAALGVVLVVKPATALLLVVCLGHSLRTGLTVAVGLAQIGEFSFILAHVAVEAGLLPDAGRQVLVAVAIISISLNPMTFRSIGSIERWVEQRPRLHRWLAGRADRRGAARNTAMAQQVAETTKPLAVIVGYGPVGRVVDALLRDAGIDTAIVDRNADTISTLATQGRMAIFGDAERLEILEHAGVRRAGSMIITLPNSGEVIPMILQARELNPEIDITVRARYLGERDALRRAGARTVIFEEGEAGMAIARQVLRRRGIDAATEDRLVASLRRMWSIEQ